MKKKSALCFFLFLILFLTSHANAIPVNYTISLYDSYGDGWNGGSIDLSINSELELDDITLIDGDGPQDWYFEVNDADFVEIDYTSGNWSYENSYEVYNNIDELVLSSGLDSDTPQDTSFTVQLDNNIDPVPEPTTMLLFGMGLFGLTVFGSRKLSKKN